MSHANGSLTSRNLANEVVRPEPGRPGAAEFAVAAVAHVMRSSWKRSSEAKPGNLGCGLRSTRSSSVHDCHRRVRYGREPTTETKLVVTTALYTSSATGKVHADRRDCTDDSLPGSRRPRNIRRLEGGPADDVVGRMTSRPGDIR